MQSEFNNKFENDNVNLLNTNSDVKNHLTHKDLISCDSAKSDPIALKKEILIGETVVKQDDFLNSSEAKDIECLKRERINSIEADENSITNETPLKRRVMENETDNRISTSNTILNIDLRSPILCESMCLNTRLSDTSEGTTISSPNTPFKHTDNSQNSKVVISSDASKSTTATTSPTMSYRINSSTFSESSPGKHEIENPSAETTDEKNEKSSEKVEISLAPVAMTEDAPKQNLANTSVPTNQENSYNLQQFAAAAAAGCVPFTIISLPNGQNVALTATPMSASHSNISQVDSSKENCFQNQEQVSSGTINNVVHDSNLLNHSNNNNSNFNAAVIAAAQQAAAFASNYPVTAPNIQGFSWPPAPPQVAVPGINAFQPGASPSTLFFPVDMSHNNHGFINLPWHNTSAYNNMQNGAQTVNQQLAQIQANLQDGNARVGDMSSVSTPYRMISPQHSNTALWNNNHFNGLGGDTSALSALSFAPQLLNLSGLPSPSSTTSSVSQKPSLTFSDVDGGATGSPTFVSVLRNNANQQQITHMNQKDVGMNHISSLLSAAAAVSNQNSEEIDNRVNNRTNISYDAGNKCGTYGKNLKSSLKVNSANVSAALDGLDVDWNSVGLREAELATHEVAKNAATLFEDPEGNNSLLVTSPGEAVLTASQLTVAARAMLKFVKGLTPTQLGINWHACTQRFCVTYTTPDETDSRTWILGAYSNGKLHYKYFGPRSWTLLGLKEALRKAFKARTSLLLGQGIIEEPEDTGLSKEELTFHARQLLQQLRDSLGVKKGNVHKGLYISWHPKTRRFVVALKSCDSGKTVYKYFSPKERSIEGIKTALLDAHQMVVAACQ